MTVFQTIEKKIYEILPDKTQVSKVDFEGPEIAIYTKNPGAFFEEENFVAKVAFELKKHVNIRTDKSLLEDPDRAKDIVAKLIPIEAEVKSIDFCGPFSEVVIEALKPGLVIGKGGETSKKIILETGWTPKIVRSPSMNSKFLTGLRQHLVRHADERKKILQETAKKIYRDAEQSPNDWVRLVALGGFQQVGRSCMLLETNHTKILLDCGINPAGTEEPYPYLDSLNFPINDLDAVLISHAHMDHCGFLPYLFKSGYDGPVYTTEPTRDLMALMQFDFIEVAAKQGKEPLYSEKDVKATTLHVIPRDYREVTDIAPDMRATYHNAAHVLGSASIHLHIGEGSHNLTYSSDIKYGFSRLFEGIDTRYPRLETLIIESTYGGRNDIQQNRQVAEDLLLKVIKETQQKDGNVLIPVFAIGRGQEIMLVLESFYQRGLFEAKCYIDGLTNESNAVHTAYPEYLRHNLQRRILQNDNPFTHEIFVNAQGMDRDEVLKDGNAIIIASSGMLTGGASLDYFYRMAENENNAVIFVGWQGQNSLGRKVQEGVKSIPMTDKTGKTRALQIKLNVNTVEGFSGHSDRMQLSAFVRNLKPRPKRVLVDHGEKNKAIEFASYVTQKFGIPASAPANLDAIRLK